MAIPVPRTPVCLRHHVRMAACPDCEAQNKAERQAALQRLERARQEAGAL